MHKTILTMVMVFVLSTSCQGQDLDPDQIRFQTIGVIQASIDAMGLTLCKVGTTLYSLECPASLEIGDRIVIEFVIQFSHQDDNGNELFKTVSVNVLNFLTLDKRN